MHFWISKNTGWIEAITGSMFSGKSEELIRRIRRAKFAGQKVIVFKHAFDKRYDSVNVVSHSQNMIEAIPAENCKDMENILLKYNDIEVIGIDEVQFFGKEIVNFIEDLANRGKRVIVAGLDMDFRGEPFNLMPEILARAEYVDKLNAICMKCGNPASRTQRIVDGEPAYYDEPVIKIGALESYEARCRKCHIVKKREYDNKIFFIVGTDTGVGKTTVTLKFLEAILKKGIKVLAIKPVETGKKDFGNIIDSDSGKYATLLGKEIEDVNCYFFKESVSPHFAAKLENENIDIEKIKKFIDEKAKEYEFLFVEGAGGLMVPFTEEETFLDIIKEYKSRAEVIIISENKLGTINHTLMTVRILKENGIKIKGIYFNEKNNYNDKEFLNENIRIVEKLSGEKIIKDFNL